MNEFPFSDPDDKEDEFFFDERRDDDNVQATMGVPKDNGPADLFHLWVHPEKRGEGKGRDVLKDAEQTANRMGAEALNVTIDDEDAERFFEKQGFERGFYEEGDVVEEKTTEWSQFTKQL